MTEPNRAEVWVTKDGRQIPFKRLGTAHLVNICAMLRRRAAVALRQVGYDPHRVTDVYPYYPALETELRLRLSPDNMRALMTEIADEVDGKTDSDPAAVDAPGVADSAARFRLLELD